MARDWSRSSRDWHGAWPGDWEGSWQDRADSSWRQDDKGWHDVRTKWPQLPPPPPLPPPLSAPPAASPPTGSPPPSGAPPSGQQKRRQPLGGGSKEQKWASSAAARVIAHRPPWFNKKDPQRIDKLDLRFGGLTITDPNPQITVSAICARLQKEFANHNSAGSGQTGPSGATDALRLVPCWADLRGMGLGDADLNELLSCFQTLGVRVERLWLTGNNLGPKSGALLMPVVRSGALEELHLSCNAFDDEAAFELLLALARSEGHTAPGASGAPAASPAAAAASIGFAQPIRPQPKRRPAAGATQVLETVGGVGGGGGSGGCSGGGGGSSSSSSSSSSKVCSNVELQHVSGASQERRSEALSEVARSQTELGELEGESTATWKPFWVFLASNKIRDPPTVLERLRRAGVWAYVEDGNGPGHWPRLNVDKPLLFLPQFCEQQICESYSDLNPSDVEKAKTRLFDGLPSLTAVMAESCRLAGADLSHVDLTHLSKGGYSDRSLCRPEAPERLPTPERPENSNVAKPEARPAAPARCSERDPALTARADRAAPSQLPQHGQQPQQQQQLQLQHQQQKPQKQQQQQQQEQQQQQQQQQWQTERQIPSSQSAGHEPAADEVRQQNSRSKSIAGGEVANAISSLRNLFHGGGLNLSGVNFSDGSCPQLAPFLAQVMAPQTQSSTAIPLLSANLADLKPGPVQLPTSSTMVGSASVHGPTGSVGDQETGTGEVDVSSPCTPPDRLDSSSSTATSAPSEDPLGQTSGEPIQTLLDRARAFSAAYIQSLSSAVIPQGFQSAGSSGVQSGHVNRSLFQLPFLQPLPAPNWSFGNCQTSPTAAVAQAPFFPMPAPAFASSLLAVNSNSQFLQGGPQYLQSLLSPPHFWPAQMQQQGPVPVLQQPTLGAAVPGMGSGSATASVPQINLPSPAPPRPSVLNTSVSSSASISVGSVNWWGGEPALPQRPADEPLEELQEPQRPPEPWKPAADLEPEVNNNNNNNIFDEAAPWKAQRRRMRRRVGDAPDALAAMPP
ncbi:unnamed protein product [Polarella glacialis]|uniref:Uncharacterized protein n=1 Tax=Polarella glacialis TaxID=89957 RepID=A0A813KJJ1_POLGL|nr:unnamed protein product [Polarella glacialis]CAE8704353.1 unnamed protein product [Polarella glacialis]